MEPTADSTSSTEARLVVLGRVVGSHGLRGQLRIRYFGDGPDELMRQDRLVLAESEDADGGQSFEVARAEPGRRGEIRLGLVGVSRREAADELRGQWVMTRLDRLEPLPAGEYYGYQLLGCRVVREDGREIGVVRDIWPTGATDVLVIEAPEGGEHLLPAVEEMFREVDLDARRIVVDVIPGLLEPA